jgi:hypothetical protein
MVTRNWRGAANVDDGVINTIADTAIAILSLESFKGLFLANTPAASKP